MQVQIEREIFIRSSRSFTVLTEAIQIFRDYVQNSTASNDPEYYRARNFLKEGKAFYEQSLQDAKKLLGPIPIYAAKDFEGWRSQALVENKIVVSGQTIEELQAELTVDDFVKTMMSAEEIEAYLKACFDKQKSGKRKLSNIKIRMVLDKLTSLLAEGQELQKTAQRKQQGLPI
ncbi:MAG: hypothetical protein MUQ25_03650 [Candidatus Aminicenantes bacterium]|nr:hypothetical protein [Candidatus Aminicenantes bacterium]MCJ7485248.1 hypothetical protein [Candidatus Aminicenantes bacterium]TFG54783.1 MAG: hypothetical protein E4H35_06835 [Candidatus Aminicenantes bacterium]